MVPSRKQVCRHELGFVRFVGATDDAATAIKGPFGKRGYLIDVGIRVTETFACDTTTAKIRIGDSTDADQHAELVIADGTAATNVFNVVDDRDAIKGELLPENTQVEVSFVSSGDSGVAAGAGYPYAIIEWY